MTFHEFFMNSVYCDDFPDFENIVMTVEIG